MPYICKNCKHKTSRLSKLVKKRKYTFVNHPDKAAINIARGKNPGAAIVTKTDTDYDSDWSTSSNDQSDTEQPSYFNPLIGDVMYGSWKKYKPEFRRLARKYIRKGQTVCDAKKTAYREIVPGLQKLFNNAYSHFMGNVHKLKLDPTYMTLMKTAQRLDRLGDRYEPGELESLFHITSEAIDIHKSEMNELLLNVWGYQFEAPYCDDYEINCTI